MQEDVKDTYADINNEVSVYKMVMETGVDAIICNRPHCAVDLIKSEEEAAGAIGEMQAQQQQAVEKQTRMPIAVSAN